MIGKDEIAEAARYADARSEELGLPGWCDAYKVSQEGLVYVAEQRALRAVSLGIDRRSPHTFRDMTERRVIRLSPLAERLAPMFAATWIDGFASGLTAKEKADG